MVNTFTTSGAVALKAGAGVSTALVDADYNSFINQAESYINVLTRVNYTNTYSSLDADKKLILDDAASSHAAIAAINYDMSGYPSLAVAQTTLDVNYTRLNDAMKLLKDKQHTDFLDTV